MARPQNTALKKQIRRAAYRQFRERGYTATSYSSIAAACGISRNLVQYHVPKKDEFVIGFLKELLARCQTELGYTDDELTGDFSRIYELGCRYFEHLLTDGYRTFLFDVIASREMTETMITFNSQWAIEHAQGAPLDAETQQRTMTAVIVSMGGFYELLYHCLRNELPFDVRKSLGIVMHVFIHSLEEPHDCSEDSAC